MATFSMKKGGKEIGSASVYAEPHNMSGKGVKVQENPGKEPNATVASIFCSRGHVRAPL